MSHETTYLDYERINNLSAIEDIHTLSIIVIHLHLFIHYASRDLAL